MLNIKNTLIISMIAVMLMAGATSLNNNKTITPKNTFQLEHNMQLIQTVTTPYTDNSKLSKAFRLYSKSYPQNKISTWLITENNELKMEIGQSSIPYTLAQLRTEDLNSDGQEELLLYRQTENTPRITGLDIFMTGPNGWITIFRDPNTSPLLKNRADMDIMFQRYVTRDLNGDDILEIIASSVHNTDVHTDYNFRLYNNQYRPETVKKINPETVAFLPVIFTKEN